MSARAIYFQHKHLIVGTKGRRNDFQIGRPGWRRDEARDTGIIVRTSSYHSLFTPQDLYMGLYVVSLPSLAIFGKFWYVMMFRQAGLGWLAPAGNQLRKLYTNSSESTLLFCACLTLDLYVYLTIQLPIPDTPVHPCTRGTHPCCTGVHGRAARENLRAQ